MRRHDGFGLLGSGSEHVVERRKKEVNDCCVRSFFSPSWPRNLGQLGLVWESGDRHISCSNCLHRKSSVV